MAKTTCSMPGCSAPRFVGKDGHVYSKCHEHFIEYFRRQRENDWEGWQGVRIDQIRKADKTICCVPECSEPRMVAKNGKTLTMCEEHQRAYWRKSNPGSGVGRGHGARKSRTRQPAPPVEPAPKRLITGAPFRIVALRCDVCCVKLPYTEEHFDVAAKSRTCRHCQAAGIVTVVNPLTNTATRYRVLGGGAMLSCGDTAESYAAFARQEQASGRIVLVTW